MNDLTCKELIDFLDDYVADALEPDRREAFESHLKICRGCRNYLATYRAAVRLSHDAAASTAEDAPEDLVKAILAARGRGQ